MKKSKKEHYKALIKQLRNENEQLKSENNEILCREWAECAKEVEMDDACYDCECRNPAHDNGRIVIMFTNGNEKVVEGDFDENLQNSIHAGASIATDCGLIKLNMDKVLYTILESAN